MLLVVVLDLKMVTGFKKLPLRLKEEERKESVLLLQCTGRAKALAKTFKKMARERKSA